jgi:WD40 repeat protein
LKKKLKKSCNLKFNPSGKDRLIKLWDLRSGELIESFRGHRDTITVRRMRRKTLSMMFI